MNQAQERMCAAASAGLSAIAFITQPEVWPAFAAYAERSVPGTTWNEADRLAMRQDAQLLNQLARTLEQQ